MSPENSCIWLKNLHVISKPVLIANYYYFRLPSPARHDFNYTVTGCLLLVFVPHYLPYYPDPRLSFFSSFFFLNMPSCNRDENIFFNENAPKKSVLKITSSSLIFSTRPLCVLVIIMWSFRHVGHGFSFSRVGGGGYRWLRRKMPHFVNAGMYVYLQNNWYNIHIYLYNICMCVYIKVKPLTLSPTTLASLFSPPSLMSTVIIIHFIFLLPLLVLTTSQLSFIFYFYPHDINRTRRVYMHREEEGE